MEKTCDVIVVGLGGMGSAAVLQLARRGQRVLGIDQFSPPHGLGSSHGDSRITRQAIGEGEEYVPLALRSYALWREIEAATGARLLETTGGLIMASASAGVSFHNSNDFLGETIAAAEKFGIAHSVLETDQIHSRFPQFNLVGDERGYYEPSMGFLRPEICVASQLALAERHGAEIRRNERVLEVMPMSGGVLIRTSAGQYRAEKLVLSAGPWVTQLLGKDFARYFSIYRQVLYWFDVTDSIDHYLPANFPVFIWGFGTGRDDFIYGIPAIDGRVGGVKIGSEQHELQADPDSVERSVSNEEIHRMYSKYVRARLPGLSDKCVKASACLYTSTSDSGFVIDFHPLQPNILIVSPCSGHGFKHSAAVGEIVSDLITTEKSPTDISKFGLGRFSSA